MLLPCSSLRSMTSPAGVRRASRRPARARLALELLEDRTVPSTATHFAVGAPPNATAGAPFTITLSALDAANQVDTSYTGTVHFTASAGSHVLPVDYTFTATDGGTHAFSGVTLGIAGSETLTAADTATPSISGVASVRVAPGLATGFSYSGPVQVTAGVPFALSLTALDQYGNLASGYRGTVHFSSIDTSAVLPGDYTFTATDGGKHTLTGFSLTTDGDQSIMAADTLTPSIRASDFFIVSGVVTHFAVSAPSQVRAGDSFTVVVTPLDAHNNPVENYTGTVHFSTTARSYRLPADYTFTSADPIATHFFFDGFSLDTDNLQTVGVVDTTNSSTLSSVAITVTPGAAASLVLSAPAAVSAGTPFSFTVTALDQSGEVATDYAGTVSLTASAGSTTLPTSYTFTAADAGSHTFTGVTLGAAGAQTITATDTAVPSVTATASISVSPAAVGAATHFAVSAPASAQAGAPFSVTVTALDQNGNVVPGYMGTVHFTASAGSHVLPADYTFTAADAGAHTFTGVKLGIAGAETLTVTDTATATLTGKASVRVTPGPGSKVVVSAPGGVTAGVLFSVTLTAYDQYGNVATGYSGTVHFASSDGAAVLPADHTFVPGDGGKHTFTGVVLKTAGSQTLTVSDALTTAVLAHTTVSVSGAAPASAANVQPAPSDLVADPATTTLDQFYAQVTAAQAGTKGHPVARKGGKKHHRHHHAQ